MAITNHYVTTTGSDTYANSTNIATPCSFTTAMAAANSTIDALVAPGDQIYIQKGAYSRTGSDTADMAGSAASPVVWRGYNVTPGDLDTPTYNADGSLNTTNYPVVTYDATFFLTIGAQNSLRNVKVASAGAGRSGAIVSAGANFFSHQCYLLNPSTNAAAACLALTGIAPVVENNDFALTGASGGAGCIICTGGTPRIIANRFINSQTFCIVIGNGAISSVILDNVAFQVVVGPCVNVTNTTTSAVWTIRGNTWQGKTTAIQIANVVYANLSYYGDNVITDCTTGILSLYNATAQLAGIFSHNRFRDNTADVTGWTDWYGAGSAANVTTDTGAQNSDYISYAANLYQLIAGSPGVGAASVPNRDIGALQRARGSGGVVYYTPPPSMPPAGKLPAGKLVGANRR